MDKTFPSSTTELCCNVGTIFENVLQRWSTFVDTKPFGCSRMCHTNAHWLEADFGKSMKLRFFGVEWFASIVDAEDRIILP